MESFNNAIDAIRSHIYQLNEFEIYANNTTNSLHNDYVYKFALSFERVDDPVTYTLFVQKYWYHSITISILYFISVKFLQHVMSNREPFQLKRPLLLWNTFLAVFSFFGFIRTAEVVRLTNVAGGITYSSKFISISVKHKARNDERLRELTLDVIYSLYYLGVFHSLCYTINPYGVAAFWALLFAISKVVELGDTYFIVLKKKPLTFLHCYHHIVVLIGTIHGGAAHSAHGRFFITMNYFVHCIMYSYFAYTSYGWRPSRSMSMLVTTLQIAQMLIGITINSLVHQIKLYETAPCQQTMGHVYLGYFIYGSFAALFIHFYINAYYLSPRSKHRKTE